jgi:hypothetical protein
MVYHVAKRAFAGAIADKSFIVFKFNVIAVDVDRQADDGSRAKRPPVREF